MTKPRDRYILAAGIALATIALYLPALRNGFVNWDDNIYVFQNPHIRSLGWRSLAWAMTDASLIYWHPLTKLSHALDYALYGLDPLGHHLTNIVLHAVNTYLVVLLVIRLGETAANVHAGPEGSLPGDGRALLVAGGVAGLLFGIHPLHVESVAWVSERKDLLCALFTLLSINAYVYYASARGIAPAKIGWRQPMVLKPYLFSLVFALLALASKPMAVTLPLVLVLLDWYPLQRIRPGEGLLSVVMEKIPFFAAGLTVSVWTYLAQRSLGALVPIAQLPFSSRILVASASIMKYLGKMVLPVDLVPLYAHFDNVSLRTGEYAGAALFVSSVTICCVAFARTRPLLLSLWGYYLITLLPVLGLVQAGMQSMADRFTYLPSIGPFVFLGAAVAWLWQRTGSGTGRVPAARPSIIVAGVMLTLSLAYGTHAQIGIWKDTMTLWDHTIRTEPGSSLAYVVRGWEFQQQGNYDRALEDYSRAITLDMGNYMAYNSRGEALRDMGLLDDALADFTTAIVLNPMIAIHFTNRGIVLANMGKQNSAIEDFTTALALRPDSAISYMNRGIVLAGMGQTESALKDLTSAVNADPGDYLAYTNRATAYRETGKTDLALSDYGAAVAIAPERWEAYRQRGLLYRDAGQWERAIEDLSAAMTRKPDLVENYLDRGACYRMMGETGRAEQDYRRACELGSREGCTAVRRWRPTNEGAGSR